MYNRAAKIKAWKQIIRVIQCEHARICGDHKIEHIKDR